MPPEIFIYDEIGAPGLTAKEFIDELEALGDVPEIKVRINSDGGSVSDGVAIFNALQNHSAKVITSIDGGAFSAAAYIAMAGDEREMSENAILMIHGARAQTEGNVSEHQQSVSMLKSANAGMASTFQTITGKTEDDILALMAVDTWMDADQALAEGFVTTITGASKLAASLKHKTMPPRLVAQISKLAKANETLTEGTEMSETTTPAKPTEATLEELEIICKNRPEAFIDRFCRAQQKLKASLSDAQTAYTTAIEAELAARDATIASLQTQLAQAQEEGEEMPEEEEEPEATAKTGTKPVANAGSTSTPTARQEWKTKIDAEIASGVARPKAVSNVNRRNPGLRQRYLAEVN